LNSLGSASTTVGAGGASLAWRAFGENDAEKASRLVGNTFLVSWAAVRAPSPAKDTDDRNKKPASCSRMALSPFSRPKGLCSDHACDHSQPGSKSGGTEGER
jgi:hypothetical protein